MILRDGGIKRQGLFVREGCWVGSMERHEELGRF